MANILMAEDDQALAENTQKWLILQNHKVDLATSGQQAWEMVEAFGYDILILDWDLPELQGIEILKRVRIKGDSTPVLMLTGKDQIEHKEQAFEAGSDDYLTKPFHPRELSARLKALLRRPSQTTSEKLRVRDIEVDLDLRKVCRCGEQISLQPLELDLLIFFVRHPNQIFRMEALMQRVWGSDSDVSLEAVYACIKRLRRKLDRPGETSILRNVFGSGYCMDI